MSTRAFIGFPAEDTITGVYHHSDGYPEGLGRVLFHLAQVYDDLGILRDVLCSHPSGYSSLMRWSGAPDDLIGYDMAEGIKAAKQKQHDCLNKQNWGPYYADIEKMGHGIYYDGERAEPNAELMRWEDLPSSWCAYAYLLYPITRIMVIYEVAYIQSDLPKALNKLGIIDLDQKEQNFPLITITE